MAKVEPCLVVHGGAWKVPERLWNDSIKGVKKAAMEGYKVRKTMLNNLIL